MLGWTVLNNLKLDPATRHIPVQMLSVEEERQHGLSHGAFSYLVKPATTEDLGERVRSHQDATSRRTRKRLLVVEDNEIERQSIVELLGHDDIEIDGRRHRQRGARRRCSTGRSTAASSICGCRT